VREELLSINCIGSGGANRLVYIAVDWNGTGQARERALDLEYDLKKLFQELGAKVYMLRWPTEEGAGEQKLDDWLVAGGEIGQAMRLSQENADAIDTEIAELWQYFNDNYVIMHGFYIPLSNVRQKYTITAFRTMEPDKKLQVSAKKFLHPDDVWGRQPRDDRNVVDGYIFKPAPLGHEVERYVWEDGKRLLNTAPELNWDMPPWVDLPPDVGPFLELIGRLCQSGGEWFVSFLAHCAQRPTERGPHIIIFKDDGGTGKSLLFDTMDQVFGKYSGPIGDALTSSFNAELEHLVIAWWSDPVIHGGANRDLESALKNFSGDSKLTINIKGGAKYTVKNYGRLLIATNKDWIVPVSSRERRFTVFGGLIPMTHAEAAPYARWLRSGGVQEIRRYLTEMDLSDFDIQAPGPRTIQREEMETLSAPPLVRILGYEPFTNKDVWELQNLMNLVNEMSRKMGVESIGRELTRLGGIHRKIRANGGQQRYYAIRNFAKWDTKTNEEWITECVGAKF
jgi:hypothetical protein